MPVRRAGKVGCLCRRGHHGSHDPDIGAARGSRPGDGLKLSVEQVREQAVREADETRRSADMYAMTVLERLEREVARILATVQRGKAVLSERTGRTPPVTGNAARLDNGKLASV